MTKFFKTTLVGGMLVLLPLYLIVLVLLKLLAAVKQVISPIVAGVPATAEFPGLVAGAIILAACFVAGLVVRTSPGRRTIDTLQSRIFEKIPGYKPWRDLLSRLGGDEGVEAFLPALVEIEEALVPAVIIEELSDGQFVILVPSVPTPFGGALYILPAARVHRVQVPLKHLLRVYSKGGVGAGELVSALRESAAARVGQ
jgi:uncharacterized membrane protein